ncbi:hypothetical protein ACWDQO_35985 [Streptomyces sp. NPDC003703]|uniref:hypothetical protein n=1 Tax=Streptomyces sp. NPDC003283 TaxID=3364681 RepID=UPI0036A5FF67
MVLQQRDVVARATPAGTGTPPNLTACAGDSAAALALYRWNSDLARAFFEPLGHLEITLRNALDARLVARQQRRGRTTEWYTGRKVPPHRQGRGDITQARERAERRGAATTPRGKGIVELGFGFRRFLLARQYKLSQWPDLAGAFPHAPKRTLTTVENPVKRLHQFRNRITHHEGIWHLPLEARRDDIQTVLSFIAPAASTWVADAFRIDDVLAHRRGTPGGSAPASRRTAALPRDQRVDPARGTTAWCAASAWWMPADPMLRVFTGACEAPGAAAGGSGAVWGTGVAANQGVRISSRGKGVPETASCADVYVTGFSVK